MSPSASTTIPNGQKSITSESATNIHTRQRRHAHPRSSCAERSLRASAIPNQKRRSTSRTQRRARETTGKQEATSEGASQHRDQRPMRCRRIFRDGSDGSWGTGACGKAGEIFGPIGRPGSKRLCRVAFGWRIRSREEGCLVSRVG